MPNDLSFYEGLITSEHSDKPVFMGVLDILLEGPVGIQDTIFGLINDFDIDLAVGVQLDVIGEWVGLSRKVEVPITGVYFTWDDVPSDGWDYGLWQGEFDPTEGLTSLPDDIYRQALYTKILLNHWDGSIPGAYTIYNTLLAISGNSAIIQDNENMSMIVGVLGATLPPVILALLTGGYLDIRPEGVGIAYYGTTTAPGPFFGFDVENSSISGYDVGQWPIENI